jgi:hypothetical protein
MIIRIKQSATKFFELIGGLGTGEFEEEFKINGQPLVQVGEHLRAVNAKPYGRGNMKTTVSWTATKEHNSMQEAEAFQLLHHSEIPTTGSLVCTAEGNGRAPYTLSNAQLQSHDGSRIGVTTIHKYIFTGGDFAGGE